MDPAGTLIGLAEVSLTLAGFAAIVLVLGSRDAPLGPEMIADVRIMITNAAGSALCCLVAIAFLSLDVTPPHVWLLSSAFVLVGVAVISAANFLLIVRHLEGYSPRLVFLWWSFAAVGAAIHLANALGLFGGPSFGLFFLGMTVLLAQAGTNFVYMVSALLGRSAA
jgi:hypothetical protein